MGAKDKNDQLRDERYEQREHRQERRDEIAEEIDGARLDQGSQDEQRNEGDAKH